MNNLPPIEEPQAHDGFLRALWRTWVSACFHPNKFFETVGNSQNLTTALLFGFGCWVIVGLLSPFVIFLTELPDTSFQKEFGLFLFPLSLVGCVVQFALTLLYGLILHLFLLFFGGARQGLSITLRVVAYAQAPIIFFFCGSGIWTLLLYIVGLAAAHRTDTWRSVLAVLVSFIPCCFGGALWLALLEAGKLG